MESEIWLELHLVKSFRLISSLAAGGGAGGAGVEASLQIEGNKRSPLISRYFPKSQRLVIPKPHLSVFK